jgi:hypothetical protein
LAISKKLVEFMGGKISATSKINEGSTFKVFSPIIFQEIVNKLWIHEFFLSQVSGCTTCTPGKGSKKIGVTARAQIRIPDRKPVLRLFQN